MLQLLWSSRHTSQGKLPEALGCQAWNSGSVNSKPSPLRPGCRILLASGIACLSRMAMLGRNLDPDGNLLLFDDVLLHVRIRRPRT